MSDDDDFKSLFDSNTRDSNKDTVFFVDRVMTIDTFHTLLAQVSGLGWEPTHLTPVPIVRLDWDIQPVGGPKYTLVAIMSSTTVNSYTVRKEVRKVVLDGSDWSAYVATLTRDVTTEEIKLIEDPVVEVRKYKMSLFHTGNVYIRFFEGVSGKTYKEAMEAEHLSHTYLVDIAVTRECKDFSEVAKVLRVLRALSVPIM